MNAIMLLTAMTTGQPPGPSYLPPTRGGLATAQPPMTLPMTAPMTQPMGQPKTDTPGKWPTNNGNGASNGDGANGNGNGNGNGEEKKEDADKKEPEAPEPYALMRILSTTRFGQRLDDSGISISGWVQGNYTTSTANRNNLPVTFNDRGDFWQMNQNFLRVTKDVDPTKDEFQLGFRTEWILPGTDGRFSIARGLFDDQLKGPGRNGALPNYYPIDLFQAYVETFNPNLGPKGSTVRIGKFATHVGYELVQGAETPFLSRSYMFQYNPFTHSGIWAITPLNDTWTTSNGFAVGSDNFFGDPTNRFTYLGQLKWAPKDGKTSALFNVVLNDNNFQVNQNFPLYNVYNAVVTHNFSDRLTYVLDAGFSHIDGAPLPSRDGARGSANWYGAAQYLIYKHCNDKFTSNFRVELFNDTQGFRTGFKGLYTDVAYNLAYQPVRSVILRPGVRYDHNNTSAPFEGKPNLFTATMDMIVRY